MSYTTQNLMLVNILNVNSWLNLKFLTLQYYKNMVFQMVQVD